MYHEEYLTCSCYNLVHTVRFMLDLREGELNIDYVLNDWHPWYRRAWYALKYVFKREHPRHGHYDTMIIRVRDYDKLIAMLNTAKEINTAQEKEHECRILPE